jgi:DNA-binding NarL/FixJ family response regulator
MVRIGEAAVSSPVRILVADDSDLMRRSLRSLLETHIDWQVCDEACNGREAVNKADLSSPDVVLLDFEMPEMNGLEAAREIRQHFPTLPILMVSLHMSQLLEAEAKKAGIQGACAKGDIGCLLEAVATLLHRGTYYRN